MCIIHQIDFKQISPDAERQLRAKMELEEMVKPALRGYFRRIIRDFRKIYAASGRPINMDAYKSELEVILTRHYERVQRRFKDNILNRNGGKNLIAFSCKQTSEERQRLDELIIISLAAWAVEKRARALSFITATNDEQMLRAIEAARRELIDAGMPIDNRTLAVASSSILSRAFNTRVDRIAVTETEESAEATNQIVASATAGAVPFSAVAIQGIQPAVQTTEVIKTWRDMNDSVVRPSHRLINGTSITESGIFIVGGSRLRFPSDTSLGASISEIINCRCFADYQIGFPT